MLIEPPPTLSNHNPGSILPPHPNPNSTQPHPTHPCPQTPTPLKHPPPPTEHRSPLQRCGFWGPLHGGLRQPRLPARRDAHDRGEGVQAARRPIRAEGGRGCAAGLGLGGLVGLVGCGLVGRSVLFTGLSGSGFAIERQLTPTVKILHP